MPLFRIENSGLRAVGQADFKAEKVLQKLVESSLETVFRCRLVASEFSTGTQHGGRIDTLALSEDGNPVIIEYKKVPSSELVTQSLYYLAWLCDHKGDFELAAKKSLGPKVEIVWDDIRVICLAPSYRKFDLHAAQVMPANLELWTFRLFANDTIFIEEVQQKDLSGEFGGSGSVPLLDPKKKASGSVPAAEEVTVDKHLEGRPPHVREILLAVQEYILGLDAAIEENPKKLYIAYRTTQNIVCVEPQQKKVLLFLKVDPTTVDLEKGFTRDVSEIGHFGTGDLEVTVASLDDLEKAKPLIKRAYQTVGS